MILCELFNMDPMRDRSPLLFHGLPIWSMQFMRWFLANNIDIDLWGLDILYSDNLTFYFVRPIRFIIVEEFGDLIK